MNAFFVLLVFFNDKLLELPVAVEVFVPVVVAPVECLGIDSRNSPAVAHTQIKIPDRAGAELAVFPVRILADKEAAVVGVCEKLLNKVIVNKGFRVNHRQVVFFELALAFLELL